MHRQPRSSLSTQVPKSPRSDVPAMCRQPRVTCTQVPQSPAMYRQPRVTCTQVPQSPAMYQRCTYSLRTPAHKFHNHQRCTDSLGSLAHKFHNHQRCTAYGSPAMYILPRDTSTQVPRSPAMYSVWGTCTQATHSPVLYCVTQSPVCTSQVSSRSLRHLHGNHTITTECCAGGHKTVTGLH